MPRPTLPPTPASSTDIKGKDGSKSLASLQMSFELPPPAMPQDRSAVSPTDTRTSQNASQNARQPPSPESTAYPMQAAETVKSRRRPSSTVAQKSASTAGTESFALPPPPTRSRKIIQMKPCPSPEESPENPTTSSTSATSKASATKKTPASASSSAASTSTAKETTSKKKQPSASSAAGRKIARKTAHSLIERRRRSKMNEEFAVLKGMIPACTGEMHKLAILQASIEYVRYLEDCVSKLKAQRDAQTPTEPMYHAPSWNPIPQFQPSFQGDVSADVDMTGSEAVSPTFTAQPSRTAQPSVSPALAPEDARNRHDSYSSTSTEHHRHYSYSASSATASPAFGPQQYHYGRGGGVSLPPSALTSPAILPQREQRDLDQEATAALLMLNSDRRGANNDNGSSSSGGGANNGGGGSHSGRSMSVRDLLST